MGVQGSQQQQAAALAAASKKYGVPTWVLLGVYGAETGFGSNVTTSSAGAVGAFQFTAPDKGTGVTYPMTNSPTLAQFQQQADAAAAYLASLYKSHGNNWDAALQAYSGGGYGLSHVQDEAKNAWSWLFALRKIPGSGVTDTGIQAGINTVGNIVSGAASAAAAIGNIASLLTSTSFWIRAGEVIAGIILVAMGLRSATGSASTPVTVVQAAARAVT